MTDNEKDVERESEEVDIEPYEGSPEFEDSPSKQSNDDGVQDDEGDDLSTADNRVEGLVDAPQTPPVPPVPNA